MRNALVLMTALAPTTGHTDILRFAATLPDTRVWVLVNGRSFEPIPTELRVTALQENLKDLPHVVIRGSVMDDAPQNPEGHPHFWDWWREEVTASFPEVGRWTYVVAAEAYGKPLAETMGAEFMPYDEAREINKTRGTLVRENIMACWLDLIPEFRKELQLTATFFGQESTGKTTLCRRLAEELNQSWLFEFARPYLMALDDPTVTPEVMDAIHRGQYALQSTARSAARTPILLQDTDLFSTVGYWGFGLAGEAPVSLKRDARKLRSSVYYLMPDDIPMEQDRIRYGGDVRTSSRAYWRQLLAEEGLECVEVPSGTLDEKMAFVSEDLLRRFSRRIESLRSFKRT